jgi:hypothetical protein
MSPAAIGAFGPETVQLGRLVSFPARWSIRGGSLFQGRRDQVATPALGAAVLRPGRQRPHRQNFRTLAFIVRSLLECRPLSPVRRRGPESKDLASLAGRHARRRDRYGRPQPWLELDAFPLPESYNGALPQQPPREVTALATCRFRVSWRIDRTYGQTIQSHPRVARIGAVPPSAVQRSPTAL